MKAENTPKGKGAWTVKVGEKGQIVIPKEARDMFGICPGDSLMLLADEEKGIAIPPKSTKHIQQRTKKIMANAIEIKNLTKKFGKKTAIDNVSLNVPENGIFSLLGVNGAGKTTMIKILSGLSKASSGYAQVLGYDVEKETDKVKSVINISTQETAIAPNLTVKENLYFIARIYGLDKEEAEKRVEIARKQFALDQIMKTRTKTLSGGWQRKVSIAMATITNPKVLFLDEPTLGLDVLARRELWKTINVLKENTTIILTTHYMEEAEALSDYVAIMVEGEIKDMGTVEGLKDKYGKATLEDVFVAVAQEEM